MFETMLSQSTFFAIMVLFVLGAIAALIYTKDDKLANFLSSFFAILGSLLGIAYSMKGMDKEAMAEFNKALDIDPCHEYALYNMALLYDKTGNVDEAIRYYNKALDSNSTNSDVQYCLGKDYMKKKQYDDAINAFQIAVMSNAGNIEIYNDIGNAYKAKGMDNDAEGYFSLYKKQKKSGKGK